jgi:DNA anti-recombination protein RmuC
MADDLTARATKGGIGDLCSELHRTQDQLRERIENVDTRLGEAVSSLEESIHESQTEILRAIYGFAESAQQQFEEMDQTEASLKMRVTIIEGRLPEVEKRLNIPPAA